MYESIQEKIAKKTPGQVDSPEIQKIKGLIRRGEAKAGARYVGLPDEQMHFLDMPFYETGLVKKKPLGEEDIKIIVDLLRNKTASDICCWRFVRSTWNPPSMFECYF